MEYRRGETLTNGLAIVQTSSDAAHTDANDLVGDLKDGFWESIYRRSKHLGEPPCERAARCAVSHGAECLKVTTVVSREVAASLPLHIPGWPPYYVGDPAE